MFWIIQVSLLSLHPLATIITPDTLVYTVYRVSQEERTILGDHSIGHSKQKTLYEHVSYSERFPR
jgi:hypothetical protein